MKRLAFGQGAVSLCEKCNVVQIVPTGQEDELPQALLSDLFLVGPLPKSQKVTESHKSHGLSLGSNCHF